MGRGEQEDTGGRGVRERGESEWKGGSGRTLGGAGGGHTE